MIEVYICIGILALWLLITELVHTREIGRLLKETDDIYEELERTCNEVANLKRRVNNEELEV